jgi:hypothetical protein
VGHAALAALAACSSGSSRVAPADAAADLADAACPIVSGDAPPIGACANAGACLQVRARGHCPDGTAYDTRVWDCLCQSGEWQCPESGGLSIPDCLLDAGACVPHTCASLGYACGPADDGCGRPLDCGSCGKCQSCGGGGVPHVCGGAPCCPIECDATRCGKLSDGCGSLLDCGACGPGQGCGAGGVPNRCATLMDAGAGD